MMGILNRLKRAVDGVNKTANGEWRYEGVTNRFIQQHSWTNGSETVNVYRQGGAGPHGGFVAQVPNGGERGALVLSNGFVSFDDALILADLYMSDDRQNPAVQMKSERAGPEGDAQSVEGGGVTLPGVSQDRWLSLHRHDYEFGVIDRSEIDQ